MFLIELCDDNICAYSFLAFGTWHFFGNQIINWFLSTPVGSSIYCFVMPFFA